MKKELIIIATIIGVAIVVYGAFGYKAKLDKINFDREKIDAAQEMQSKRYSSLQTCLGVAESQYGRRWNADPLCVKEDDGRCLLPNHRAIQHDEQLKDAKARCVDIYESGI